MNEHPNVLFIIPDQHNARCMSVAGHPDVKTPWLDKLANEGAYFRHAFVQNPVCTPSRMSFLTGQYTHVHGTYAIFNRCRPNLYGMHHFFKENGYEVAAIGKQHVDDTWFCHQLDYWAAEIQDHTKYLNEAPRIADYAAYLNALGLSDLDDSVILPEDKLAKDERPKGFQPLDGRPSKMPLEHSLEFFTAKQAIHYLENVRNKKKPFFMWLGYHRPHEIYTPSEPYASMYPPESIHLPPHSFDEFHNKPPRQQNYAKLCYDKDSPIFIFGEGGEVGLRRVVANYLGLVSQVDESIGKVISYLDEIGELDNTIVVYTSDHGDYAGEHGLIEKKCGISYDAITRVPLIIRYPKKVKAGKVVNSLVESIDVFGTLAQLAGFDPPTTVQGKSLLPYLESEDFDKELREAVFCENNWTKCIRTKEWKLVHYPEQEYGELYNLKEDPWEQNNLYFEREYKDLIIMLRTKLLDWFIKSERPVTYFCNTYEESFPDRDGRAKKPITDINYYYA